MLQNRTINEWKIMILKKKKKKTLMPMPMVLKTGSKAKPNLTPILAFGPIFTSVTLVLGLFTKSDWPLVLGLVFKT